MHIISKSPLAIFNQLQNKKKESYVSPEIALGVGCGNSISNTRGFWGSEGHGNGGGGCLEATGMIDEI